MGDHFGKGLLAGLKAENLKPETELSRFAPTTSAALCSAMRTIWRSAAATRTGRRSKPGS